MAVASKQAHTVHQSLQSSNDDMSPMEDPAMHQFAAVLAQLKHENVASLVSSIRQGNESLHKEISPSTRASLIGCKVLPKPLYGSFHLAYRVLFDDGVEWILKIPANGHHACYDRLASEALTSEALTMRFIKQTTTIPVPTVHRFHASPNNVIGCPYILMDFLKGKPVWQGWFDEQASPSKLEQFRARSLQTIAAAMVQLNQFALDRGGSLRFDSDGRPVDVASTKVPDWVAEQDALQGLTTLDEGCPFCEKGPTADPASSLLFILDRRGIREKDQAYDRGVHEALRLFTRWTLEKAEGTSKNGPQFVLAHPDFALQNILVEDDGTLCGVIDWDGVAAVPLSVGCLKYPDWLMSDWHPCYQYDPKESPQRANSPEELIIYRNMYAQFVELSSSIRYGSNKAGKSSADITRMSLIAGTLSLAATDLKLTDGAVDFIFEKLEALTAEGDDSDVSDTESESSVGTNAEHNEEENSGSETAPMELKNSFQDDGEKSNKECLCRKCIAELALDQPSTDNVDEKSTEMNTSAVDTPPPDRVQLKQEHSGVSVPNNVRTEEATGIEGPVGTRKALVAKLALDLGEKGCRGMSKVFHKERLPQSQLTRKGKVAKWALGIGEKGCKRLSKAFHTKEEAFGLQSKNPPEGVPAPKPSRLEVKPTKVAICLCDRSEILLRKIAARLHRHSTSGTDGSVPKGTKITGVQKFFRRLIGLLRDIIRKSKENADDDAKMPPDAEIPTTETPSAGESLTTKVVSVDTEDCQRCNLVAEDPSRETQNDGSITTKVDSEDIWASIAAKVDKGGISIDLINKNRDMIAQCVIKNLGKEMEREEDEEPLLKNRKVTRKAKKAAKQAGVTKENFGSNKPELTQQSDLVNSENVTYPEAIVIAPGDPDLDPVYPEHIRPHNENCEPSEPESLLSKLQAAKQRFDLKMALKGRSSRSARTDSRSAGATKLQHEYAKSQTSVDDLSNLEAIEEANQKLRVLLSNLARPNAAVSHLRSNVFQGPEENGPALKGPGPDKSYASRKHTMSPAAIASANRKLRMVLAGFQKPKAADLRQNLLHGREGEDKQTKGEQESQTPSLTPISDTNSNTIATQLHKAVKCGQWFETPRGSLKRLEEEKKVNDGSRSQDSISPPGSCFSDINGGSSKTSEAYGEDENLENVPGLQLKFPTPNQTGKVHVFQVPDIEEDVEGYDVDRVCENEDGGESDELEDGEIVEESRSSADLGFHGEGAKVSDEEVNAAEANDNSKEREVIDSGYFAMGEVCVALGNGNLDEKRMTRLREGFMALLDDSVGLY